MDAHTVYGCAVCLTYIYTKLTKRSGACFWNDNVTEPYAYERPVRPCKSAIENPMRPRGPGRHRHFTPSLAGTGSASLADIPYGFTH